MKKLVTKSISLLGLIVSLSASASSDLKELQSFVTLGDANWKLADDALEANAGTGYLVTKNQYADFDLSLEFYADIETNSGVFFRCEDAKNITDLNCYEANIFDTRPEQTYRSGAITGIAAPVAKVDTEGRWNEYRIVAQGPLLTIRLNGIETVRIRDDRHSSGVIALQYMKGGIKFRNVKIKDLNPHATNPSLKVVGVWDLEAFTLDDGQGNVTPWCEGAHGVLIYTEGYMSVAINCTNNPAKMVHYSGPYHVEGDTVVHNVQNFGDPSLKQVFRRSIEMPCRDMLNLSGPFGKGGKAVISWRRRK